MTEREIFLAVLDLPDPAARAQYLDGACGGDHARRARIESLLLSHDAADSFLDNPAVNPPAPDPLATQELGGAATPNGDANEADADLMFLAPPRRPDSLGRIGHYEVLEVLGRGGFGIVFRAFDETLQRVVAVKVMAPQIATLSPARKRFLREAQSSAQVRHENVVQVYEVGEQPLPYLAMEFIPGETLQQKLDRTGPLEVPEVLRIGRQIAEGLAAAHAMDLIHRDIKPANVLIEGGPQQRVKITDFGLARAADDASISQSGVIAGTPMYMAPEQALGHKLDQRADLFSLGSVLYQMVAGRPPFRAPSTLAVLKRVAEESPRPIPEIIPETPAWLCEIIAKLHAKNPDERFQSAREIAEVLADCEAQLKAHAKIKDFSRIPRGKRRRSGRWKWAAAAAVVLLPVIALAVTEFAGVTHLVRGRQTTTAPITPEIVPTPVAANGMSDAEGWVQLFNGKDLEGLKVGPPENWKIQDKVLVGKALGSVQTERADYRNYHIRIEAKINKAGTGGYYFANVWGAGEKYNRSIRFDRKRLSLPGRGTDREVIPADTWFEQELIVESNYVTCRINGQTVSGSRRYDNSRAPGPVSAEVWDDIEIHIRKIEIKELPASSPAVPKTAADVLPPTFKNSIGMEFVIVPKGKSWLGGGKDKLGDKEVVIPADFYLGKYEVTQAEWEKVMGENPSWFSRTGDGKDAVKDISDVDLNRFPVENVSWEKCQLFVAKLNKLEKETGWVYRLPKELEWEYACRGGPMADKADSAFDYYFAKPSNTLLLEQANFSPDGDGKGGLARTCKVGSYNPNKLALFDMHGNVWQWCADLHDPKASGPGASDRVGRGGGWRDSGFGCTAAYRYGIPASVMSYALGLRLARVPSGTPSPEAKTPVIAPFTDADVQRIAALPAEQQVEEVRKELKRRNPGFDGKMETKIEGGVVTEIRIVTDQVTDIAPIRVFNALRGLGCTGTDTDKPNGGLLADLTPLEGMNLAGLRHLRLAHTKVSDAGMVYFKDCKGLINLELKDTKVTDRGLAHFKNCKDLAVLDLTFLNVTDAGLDYFKDCKDLRYLHLPFTKVTDVGLAQFKHCKNLVSLGLDGTRVSDVGLAHFNDCKSLTGLYLQSTQVSDAGLIHFKHCKNLSSLDVSYTGVGDSGLANVQGMPLRELKLQRTGITDLTPLQGMPLEEIRLTPKNITQGLDILRDMKSLKTIGIEWNHTWPAAEFWERYDKGEFTK